MNPLWKLSKYFLKKGQRSMKQAFSFRLTHLHERSIRLTLMMVVLATVIMVVMVFAALPLTQTAHANYVDTLTFVSPYSSHSCPPGNKGQNSRPQRYIKIC